MNDVTYIFNIYRESIRHTWNVFYMPIVEKYGGSWELEESFCKIEVELFDALIAYPLDDDISKLDSHMNDPTKGLYLYCVEPSSDAGVPVFISREKGKTRYWDYPLEKLAPGDAEMRFVRFFDFASDNYIDCKYVISEILSSDKYPELSGRFAMIEMQYVKIFKAEQDA
jgi:hypothetical protein